MTDQSMAQENPVENPDTAMPAVDQTSSETLQSETAAPSEVSDQSQGSVGLPEDASERTRQEFKKFEERNSELAQQLREERSRREYAESVFQQFTPRQPVVEPPKPVPLVDPSTGLLNEHVLSDMQRQTRVAEEKATKAEQAFQQYQIAQERKEAYLAHPELNPEGKSFSKEISIETRKIILDNMTHPEDYNNRQLSFKEAADLVKERLQPMIDNAQKQGAKKAIEQITPKEQASLEVTGTPTTVTSRYSKGRRRLIRSDRATHEGSLIRKIIL